MARRSNQQPQSSPPQEHDVPCAALQEVQLQVAEMHSDVGHFKEWQTTQNGTLLRLEQKLDQLMWRVVYSVGGLAVALLLYVVEEAIRG